MVNIEVHAWQGIAMQRLSGFADVSLVLCWSLPITKVRIP